MTLQIILKKVAVNYVTLNLIENFKKKTPPRHMKWSLIRILAHDIISPKIINCLYLIRLHLLTYLEVCEKLAVIYARMPFRVNIFDYFLLHFTTIYRSKQLSHIIIIDYFNVSKTGGMCCLKDSSVPPCSIVSREFAFFTNIK